MVEGQRMARANAVQDSEFKPNWNGALISLIRVAESLGQIDGPTFNELLRQRRPKENRQAKELVAS
jgi:hypothetical protein